MKAYQIPDVIDPGSMVCFRVLVPADEKYIGSFWAAYEYFTSWLAWERDGSGDAKAAADVWRVAYETARAEFETLGGVCVTDVRQSPTDPCKLEKLEDGSWVEFADLLLCDPSDTDWFFDGGTLDQQSIATGLAVSEFWRNLYNDAWTEYQGGGTRPVDISTVIKTKIGVVQPGIDVSEITDALLEMFTTGTVQQVTDQLDDSDPLWQQFFDDTRCLLTSLTELSDAMVETMTDNAQDWMNYQIGQGDDIASLAWKGIYKGFSSLRKSGLARTVREWTGGEFTEGFGPYADNPCSWYHDLDVTQSAHGWTVATGSWVNGVGFVSGIDAGGNPVSYARRVFIRNTFAQQSTIKRLKIYFSTVIGPAYDIDNRRIAIADDNWPPDWFAYEGIPYSSLSPADTGLAFRATSSLVSVIRVSGTSQSVTNPEGEAIIHRIEVWGDGFDPWA